jgi:hypothetical protein
MSNAVEATRFGWALDDTDHPTPIALAQPGAQYTCPVCGGEMKPTRRGSKPSYNHRGLAPCTPAEVAQKSAVYWLANTLHYFMESGEACTVGWKAEGREFESNWLAGVIDFRAYVDTPFGAADLALMGANDEIKSVFFTQKPDMNVMKVFADAGIPVALPETLPFLEGQVTLGILLRNMDVLGGWWLLQDDVNDPNLQTKPATLWGIFRDVLANSPFSSCARLETLEGFDFVASVNGHHLWLPMELWDAVFGGTRNRINRELTIISDQWPQPDSSVIELFYVILQKRGDIDPGKQDRAIGMRRHFPQEGGILRTGLDYAIKPNANAEEIACALVRSRTGDLRF